MTEVTIGQTRNSFSAVIAELASGRTSEYLIKNHSAPLARIVPVEPEPTAARTFGISKADPFVLDDGVFDALDAEIAEEFGV